MQARDFQDLARIESEFIQTCCNVLATKKDIAEGCQSCGRLDQEVLLLLTVLHCDPIFEPDLGSEPDSPFARDAQDKPSSELLVEHE